MELSNTSKSKIIANKYELVEIAGNGGMATVWRALMHGAAGFTRPVAVKRLLSKFANNPTFLDMFVEEARVGSQLQHANIVQIIDFCQEGLHDYCLVMEWVEGIDLCNYLQAYKSVGQSPPWPLVTSIIIEALRGLSAAHERMDIYGQRAPVIHRDITPQNILIGTNGIVKLSDFGLARAMDRARMTHPDIIKGKLRYLAPEITLGQPATVRSDLFSMGIVLWEALAGRPLYDGGTDVEVFRQASQAAIPLLSNVNREISTELVTIVNHALEKDPVKRFESAREMMRALTYMLRRISLFTDAFAISENVMRAIQVWKPEVPTR